MKSTTIILLLLILTSAAFSTENPLEKRILANGMTLITQEDHSRDLIAILTYADGGNRTETPELSGLSHYFEHLIFRGGTAKQAELEMRKRFKALGTFYGYTFEDGTCYYIVVPSENLPEALERYCDVMLNLKITSEKVETERGIVLEEFSQSYFDIPSGMAYYNLYQTAFTQHPYGQTTIGDTAAVRAATLETFQKFYRERYTPDNFVTAAVGNFDTDELVKQIEATFGQHPAGGLDFELGKIEPPQTAFKQVTHFMPVSTVNFLLGFHIPEYSAPEFPALEVMNQAIGAYPSGLLHTKLAQEQGLFNYVYANVDRTKESGLMTIGGELSPDNVEQALPALFAEISQTAVTLSEDKITAAKGELIRAYRQNREMFMKRAETLCFYELTSSLPLEALFVDRIDAVTLAEIQSIARRVFRPENATLSLVLPEKQPAPDASAWAKSLQPPASEKIVKKAKMQPVEEYQLPNGAAILLQQDNSSEMASLEILIRGGQWAENEQNSGIGEFLCRLLTRGTLEFDGAYFSKIMGKYGISLTASAEPDYCKISLNATGEAFEKGLEMAVLAMTRPGFREDDVESVRSELLAEVKSLPDQTYDYTRQEFDRLLYTKSPYSRPLFGSEQSISAITKADLEKYQKEIFCGGNMVAAVAGKFDKARVTDLLIGMIGEIAAGNRFEYPITKEKTPANPVVKIIDKERAQTTYNLGWSIPSALSEDFLPLTLAQKTLGSIMFFRFVYQEGICYRMWTRNTETMGPGKFWFETGISPENYNFSMTEVLKEFNNYLKEGITEETLADAKAECLQTLLITTETSDARAAYLAKHYLLGYGPDYIFRYPHLVNHITVKEVKAAVKKHLPPEKYTLLVVGKTK